MAVDGCFEQMFSFATSICQGYRKSLRLTNGTLSDDSATEVKNGMGRHVQAITLQQAMGSLKVCLFHFRSRLVPQ